jgi:hypothetical protein
MLLAVDFDFGPGPFRKENPVPRLDFEGRSLALVIYLI